MQLNQSGGPYVSGEVSDGEHVLRNVGIRLKGMGSFRSVDEKPSFAVKFDEFVEKQTYRGLKKLMFNNSVQDSTYLAELLATQLFRDAGLPAARVTHARVRLNGRDLGLYVIIEAMNKDFLQRQFGSGKGNLYEGYLQDVYGQLDQDNGEDQSGADVRALSEACNIRDSSQRWEQLNKLLDVDRFLSFIAMELLTTHWDGYAVHFNNYRIYHDPRTDKMVFITHGLDWAFRRPNVSIQPPLKSIVVRAVLTTPQGQKLYEERIRALFRDVFKVPAIIERMEQGLARIRRAGFNPDAIADMERRAGVMRQRIELRATRVAEQLRGIEPETMRFAADGFAYPVAWRDEPDRGDALLDMVTVDAKETLHIKARQEQTRASWRSQVYLKPGWYRFEGMARTDLMNSGFARLRISGDTRSMGVSGTGWKRVAHDFSVQDPGMDVELVCELNAFQGEVWFDKESLRVKPISAREAQSINRQPVLRE
jgi:hypothetical protein